MSTELVILFVGSVVSAFLLGGVLGWYLRERAYGNDINFDQRDIIYAAKEVVPLMVDLVEKWYQRGITGKEQRLTAAIDLVYSAMSKLGYNPNRLDRKLIEAIIENCVTEINDRRKIAE